MEGSLRGVAELDVLVELIDPEVQALGLSLEQVKTDVELRIRNAGLRIAHQHRRRISSATTPYLYVNMNILKGRQVPVYACSIHVAFRQRVRLLSQNAVAYATTWEKGFVALYSVQGLERGVRDGVIDLVDRFINDYLAANQ
jgi:hypothetical protein